MKLDIQTKDITVSHDWDSHMVDRVQLADEVNLHNLLTTLLKRIEDLEEILEKNY